MNFLAADPASGFFIRPLKGGVIPLSSGFFNNPEAGGFRRLSPGVLAGIRRENHGLDPESRLI